MSAPTTHAMPWLNKPSPMHWFVLLLAITCVLAVGLPPDPVLLKQLHISSSDYRLAILTLLIPYMICWYAGFYAFAKLSEYTPYLKNAIEGKAFAQTTRGMGILAFGLVIPTLASLLLQQIAIRHTGTKPAMTIISNYLSILFPLAALVYISAGSYILATTAKVKPKFTSVRIFAVIVILLSISYTFLVSRNYYHYNNPYHLPFVGLITTFVAPYLYLWFLGLLSAYYFKLYSMHITGLLYKQALSQFATGLSITMCGSIIAQFISGSVGARESSLSWALLLNYIFLVVMAAGLIMMALSANKLKKIEEV